MSRITMHLSCLRVLPAESAKEDESVKDFARRVQTVMASSLGVEPTSHTSTDKVEYAKRKLFVQPGNLVGVGWLFFRDFKDSLCFDAKSKKTC